MKSFQTKFTAAAVVMAALMTSGAANAAVIITATEENNGTVVFATTGGALNVDAWTFVSDATVPSVINPGAGLVQMAAGTIYYYNNPQNFSATGPFGSGGQVSAQSINGPFNLDIGIDPAAGELIVPQNYASNYPIPGGTMVFNGTYASLGISPGTYIWSWGSGPTADWLTLDVIPEPSASLFSLAGIGALLVRRRRTGRSA